MHACNLGRTLVQTTLSLAQVYVLVLYIFVLLYLIAIFWFLKATQMLLDLTLSKELIVKISKATICLKMGVASLTLNTLMSSCPESRQRQGA